MENPFLNAGSVEELIAMETALYHECWSEDKINPGMDRYYEEQCMLVEEAFEVLFPEQYGEMRGRAKKDS